MQETWRHGFDPWEGVGVGVGKIPWRRKWQLTPVFLPGEFHGQRRLVSYSLWGLKDLDMTEWACMWKFDSVFSSTRPWHIAQWLLRFSLYGIDFMGNIICLGYTKSLQYFWKNTYSVLETPEYLKINEYDSTYTTFWKRQNFVNSKKRSSCQAGGWGRDKQVEYRRF